MTPDEIGALVCILSAVGVVVLAYLSDRKWTKQEKSAREIENNFETPNQD